MKLSEAILLGSIGSEQGFGPQAMLANSETKCALGAALFAIGEHCHDEMKNLHLVTKHWNWTKDYVPPPTHLAIHVTSVRDAIWVLNDSHKWTRPQIAAWITTIEPQEEPNEMHTTSDSALLRNISPR